MALTDRALNRSTLARQMLLARERVDLTAAVRRAVAIQAQEPASVYVALWNRVAGFDASDLDRTFTDGDLVRGSLMRVTLHVVDAADHPTFHQAMQGPLRDAPLNDRRFRSTGMTPQDADALVPGLVTHLAQPRTPDEISEWLASQLGTPPDDRLWWALRTFAPVVHVPTGGDWAFGTRSAYTATPAGARPDVEDAVRGLVWRYLEGFGPATERDFSQFSILRRPTVRPAFEALRDDLVVLEGPGGVTLYDLPGAVRATGEEPSPPRLLGMWDSTLLAYSDRSRIIPERYRRHVIRRNGDVLPTLLVDGYVAGVWRPVDDGIEMRSFHDLADDEWSGLEAEAASLLAMVGDRRLGRAYRRNEIWWSDLPEGTTRLIVPGTQGAIA